MNSILNKSVLIPSNQGGPFGVNNMNRLINLELDSGSTYDLTQSFVELTVSMTPNADVPAAEIDTNKYAYGGVYDLNLFNSKNPNLPISNLDLIRNVSLVSSKKGMLEQINRTNVLHTNLNVYKTSVSERESVPSSLYQTYSYDMDEKYSPFVEIHKTDSPSTYVDARLRVPLSDLLEMGSIAQFPCDDAHFGKCTIKLELEDVNRLVVSGSVGKGVGAPSGEFEILGATTLLANGVIFFRIVDNATTKNFSVSDTDFPFFVNQNVCLLGSYTTQAGAVVTEEIFTKINSIAFDTTDQQLWIVTFNDTFVPAPEGTQADGLFYNIRLRNILPQSVPAANGGQISSHGSWMIKTVTLGLVEVMTPVQPIQELEYTTFSIEEFSCDATNVLNKMFTIEPEAVNVFVLFNDVVQSNLLSSNNEIESYRMIVDSEQVVDRDVKINIVADVPILFANAMHSPLHYEMVRRLFRNSSISIHSMLSLQFTAEEADEISERTAKSNQHCLILGCPVNMTPNPKQFQLNLNMKTDTSIKSVTLFKQLIKSIKF